MRSTKAIGTTTILATAFLLGLISTARAVIVPVSENFEGAALGTTVVVDSDAPVSDLRGTAGAKPVPTTSLSLMQAGGGTPGMGQTSVKFVNDATASHGNATSNATQYLEIAVPAESTSNGSITAILFSTFPGNADGEAYILKSDIYNPHSTLNVVPRLGVSSDISPSFSNFGWHGATNAHGRMFDTSQNTNWQSWWLVVNDTAAPLAYTDPLGNVSIVAAQSTDRWIDGTLNAGGGSNNMDDASAQLMGLATGATAAGGADFAFYADNFSIQQVPEPSAFILAGLAGLAFVIRRRKGN